MKMKLSELAERTGVSVRTIRYWIAEGVLQGPSGMGPGGHYTSVHEAAVLRIKKLKFNGLSLTEIKMKSGRDGPPLPMEPILVPTKTLLFSKGSEVQVLVDDGLPEGMKQMVFEEVFRFFKRLEGQEESR